MAVVCDICWTPNPDFRSSSPQVKDYKTSENRTLFGKDYRTGGIDLCTACVQLFRERDWDAIAERAKRTIIERLEA